MREASPGPALNRYAVVSPNALTARKSSFSAPGTIAADQFLPPSVVRTYVPIVPLAHATFGLTTQRPRKSALVSIVCFCHWADAIERHSSNEMAAKRKHF